MTAESKKRKRPYSGSAILRRVIARYGWTPLKVERVRGTFRVETEEGIFALKKASCPAKKLSFLHRAMEEARSQGVDAILPWIPSGKGRPFLEEQGSAWYATRWYGEALDLQQADSEELIRQLAIFHRVLEKPAAKNGEFRYRAGKELVERWKDHRAKIQEYRSILQSREFISPFEQMLNDRSDLLDKAISFAIRGMERFIESEKGVPPSYTLCHGRIHPSNILQGEQGWKWIDWDHFWVDSPVRDLALFFRQFVDPLEGGDRILSLLDSYEQERKLSRKEKKLLALYLAYPDGIINLLRQYREPKETVAEAEAVRRLRMELDRLRGVQEMIGELWRPLSKQGNQGLSRTKKSMTVAGIRRNAGGGEPGNSSG